MMEILPKIVTADQMLEAYADRLWESVETHQLTDAAVAALTDLVVDCSSTGIILRANSAFCDFAGLDADKIQGRDGHEFAFLQHREAARMTVKLNTPSGQTLWFDRLQLSLRDPVSGRYFIRIVGRDITEHKLAELALQEALQRAEEADAAKTRFLAIVSHEIRTPLNGIIGMGKLMSDTRLSLEQQNYIEAITTSSEALLVLVNDLLHFGRSELNEDKLKNEPTNVRHLIAGVTELLAEKAHNKQLDLGYLVDQNVPETLSVDAGRLRQILFNIIGNAVKFTQTGGIRIEVAYQDEMLRIDVADSGDGISPADQTRIFEPFEQVENVFTRSHDGAGLGLAIAKRMATTMGGDITLMSSLGKGARFTITVHSENCEYESPPDQLFALDGHNILLIAKHGIEADILGQIITSNGGRFELVQNLDAARVKLSAGAQFTKIIFDSRCEGIETFDQFATLAPKCALVVLIKPNERGTIGADFQAKGHAFLTRPLRQSTCLRVIGSRKFLNRARKKLPKMMHICPLKIRLQNPSCSQKTMP
ncbi:MAG: ATP-binding protein [Ahrensia sp.]|nr:ATP-binding protein [Ahrensia sp.]